MALSSKYLILSSIPIISIKQITIQAVYIATPQSRCRGIAFFVLKDGILVLFCFHGEWVARATLFFCSKMME